MTDLAPILYRIRIGVTGHRVLAEPGENARRLEEALDKLIPALFAAKSEKKRWRQRAESPAPIHFEVISPLAEGADRLVARAVLARPGATLKAVLPLTVEDYREDFSTDESKREFAELLALSPRPVLLRSRNLSDESSAPQAQAELRRDAYKAVGQYVVDHSDVLIALWDGEPARGQGGTAEIVQCARAQRVPVIRVWHGGATLLNPAKAAMPDGRAGEGLNNFNCRPVPKAAYNKELAALRRECFSDPGKRAAVITDEAQLMVERNLFPYSIKASYLAGRAQGLYYFAGRSVYTLSAAAVACAAAGVLFPRLAAAGYCTELAILALMILTHLLNKKREWRREWIEHRFLAERLRAGVFMALSGVEPRPVNVPAYMGHSQTGGDWTLRAFDEIWSRLPALTPPDVDHTAALNAYIRTAWIGAQIKYHRGKARKENRLRKHLARIGVVVLPVTVAAAALHLALLAWQPGVETAEWLHSLHHNLHVGMAFVALLFPAIAASLAGMEAHREHLRLEMRSRNMTEQLKRLCRRMAQAKMPEEFRLALEDLDEEVMLRETQDWLMLMRYVEIKAG